MNKSTLIILSICMVILGIVALTACDTSSPEIITAINERFQIDKPVSVEVITYIEGTDDFLVDKYDIEYSVNTDYQDVQTVEYSVTRLNTIATDGGITLPVADRTTTRGKVAITDGKVTQVSGTAIDVAWQMIDTSTFQVPQTSLSIAGINSYSINLNGTPIGGIEATKVVLNYDLVLKSVVLYTVNGKITYIY